MSNPKVFAVEDGAHAGQICYWRLNGNIDPDQLSAAWERAGLDPDDLPELPAPLTALNRAVKGLQRGRRLVRPLEDRGAYAIVAETARGEELAYAQTLSVKIDAVARLVFSAESNTNIEVCDCGWVDKSDAERAKSQHTAKCAFRVAADAAGEAHPLAATIRAAYLTALNEFDTTDIAPWLVRMLTHRCDALVLRDQGGVYYVPPSTSDKWDAIVAAVRSASEHRVFRVPALASKDVLEAVLDAVEREAREEAESMANELSKATGAGKGVSERVGKSRMEKCDAVEAKVARYEELLGTKLDAIRERLGDLRANLTTAMLAEQAAADAQAAAE